MFTANNVKGRQRPKSWMPVSENQRRKQKHEDTITRLFANLMDLPEARMFFMFSHFLKTLLVLNLFLCISFTIYNAILFWRNLIKKKNN